MAILTVSAISIFLAYNQEIKLSTGMQTDAEPSVVTLDDLTSDGKYVLYENGKLTIDDFNVIKTEPTDPGVAGTHVRFLEPNYDTKIVNDDPCEYQIINYETKAQFLPALTWIDMEKAEKVGIPTVLNHEQRHFDIQEIYAKIINTEMNSQFAKHNFPCSNVDENDLDSANHQDAREGIWKIRVFFEDLTYTSQKSYDDETTPANIIDKQKNQIVWDKKIDACLSYDGRYELQGCIKLNEFRLE